MPRPLSALLRCTLIAAVLVPLTSCDLVGGGDEFACSVPAPPAEPERFLARAFYVGVGPIEQITGLAFGDTDAGLTDTLWLDTDYEPHNLGTFTHADHHPGRGVVWSEMVRVGPSEAASDLVLAAPDSGTRVLVDRAEGRALTHPRWSPDGAHVLVTERTGTGLGSTVEHVEVDPETGGERVIVRATGYSSNGHYPAYSPDGRHLAYQVRPIDGSSYVEVTEIGSGRTIRPGGADGVRLADNRGQPVLWSPGGRWIASFGEREVSADSSYATYFAARADGTETVELAYDAFRLGDIVGWAPDEECLVVLDDEGGVHVGDLEGRSRPLGTEPVPRIRRLAQFASANPVRWWLTPSRGRMVAVTDKLELTVVDLEPFVVRRVALAPLDSRTETYRIADWIEL